MGEDVVLVLLWEMSRKNDGGLDEADDTGPEVAVTPDIWVVVTGGGLSERMLERPVSAGPQKKQAHGAQQPCEGQDINPGQ